MKCSFCKNTNTVPLVNLGYTPFSNAIIQKKDFSSPELSYPLEVQVCLFCKLVHNKHLVPANALFKSDYSYFSSYSSSFLKHSKKFAEQMIYNLKLNKESFVIELASNDGYLLQFFKINKIPCLGIEPTKSTAKVAINKGIKVINDFFTYDLSKKLKKKYKSPDLIVANNVLAHVPDLNDFLKGISNLCDKNTIVSIEFHYIENLIKRIQFDTIYHEHYSYFSLIAIENLIEKFHLHLFDAEKIKTHGGSLRIYLSKNKTKYNKTKNLLKIIANEKKIGLNKKSTYLEFQNKTIFKKNDILKNLLLLKQKNKKIVAYGAAAKGNTLMNYLGIKQDFISFIVDKNPNKVGRLLPGSRIPIVHESYLKKEKPDYIMIIPWNIEKEIISQLNYVKKWNCKFIVTDPKFKIID